jgi:succinate dehydrogenase / fumarate reductase flavoprotein subunit
MGGIPTNYHGEVVTIGADGNPETVVPGLFAVGEAACVSVHGANRLGSNSLIDLVVFGRATGLHLKEADQARYGARRTAQGQRRSGADPARSLPQCQGRLAHGRSPHRNAADDEKHAAVFRDRRADGRRQGQAAAKGTSGCRTSTFPTARLIWNTDLVETLELDNLISQATVTMHGAQTARKAAAPTRTRISPIATTRTG